jgi:uncharacterized membrane protein YeaQ/YmgE (transglycosylase-associated protein family)
MANVIFAVVLPPGGMIAWLLVGLIAGFAANLMLKGSGYGMLGDIVIGLIGSFLGGLAVISFVEGPTGVWGSILVAVVGACGLLLLMWAISGRRSALRL